eukprot:SAG25_NODE_328_length_9702_cov_9.746225_7_plen_124_part_00
MSARAQPQVLAFLCVLHPRALYIRRASLGLQRLDRLGERGHLVVKSLARRRRRAMLGGATDRGTDNASCRHGLHRAECGGGGRRKLRQDGKGKAISVGGWCVPPTVGMVDGNGRRSMGGHGAP